MRWRRFSPWLAGAVIAVAGGLWLRETAEQDALHARTEAVAREERELALRQDERERLRDRLASVEASNRNEAVLPGGASVSLPGTVPPWQPGEWTAATEWSNEGRATPRAAMATLLWAAASGDLAGVRAMFSFDEPTLAKARAWFDSLPAASRAQYRTPEELVAAVTLGNIPPTRAQISWLRQTTEERAIVGMLLDTPAPASSAATLDYQPAAGGLPPSLRQSRPPYRVVVLDLQRAADGWRINVPAAAIDGMAQWLRRPGDE